MFLLCTLLLFGLFQSLLELEKDNNGKFKWYLKKILSIFYICGFIIGIIIIIIQEKESNVVKGGNGYIICFNKKNQPIYYTEIRGNNSKSVLEPNEVSGMQLCYNSFDIQNLKTECDYAVICLKVHYEDIAINKDSIEFYYNGWIPRNGNNFGGLKDWQYGYAKNWASKTRIFMKINNTTPNK